MSLNLVTTVGKKVNCYQFKRNEIVRDYLDKYSNNYIYYKSKQSHAIFKH